MLTPSENTQSTPRVDRIDEVEELIFKGCTYEEIASALRLSLHTVHWHVKRLLKARGCQTRSHLMADEIERLQGKLSTEKSA